ncbi:MAG: APC family permease [Rothia sp. (in: high G+C Gram-positive bacteria)]|nr:APC family permease [Rothia sp. (in: high G+C Gram-positive bacteria)]
MRSAATRLIFGAPVTSRQAKKGNLPKRRALPLFGADGFSSVAYAPDEILLTLLLAGHGALAYSPLVGLGIALILLIVVGTYRYNIQHVGERGDFALVYQNLGVTAAVVLGAALMVEFMLTVAVSLSSAAQYLESITPLLLGHQRLIACSLIALVTFICLHGLKVMLRISHLPSYIFLVLLVTTIGCGLIADATGQLGRAVSADYTVLVPENTSQVLTTQLGVTLLLVRAFASGAVALTGVNTVSNAVKAFAPPRQRNAATSLMVIGGISALSLLGVLYLARQTGVVTVLDPAQGLLVAGQMVGEDFHQIPVLLQLTDAIFHQPLASVLLGAATIGVLLVAAMTAFTGFPMLATAIASKQYLPVHLSARSSTALYANGVLTLGASSMLLVAIVGPNVHTLVQMYIVGVFTALTLTQYAVLRNRWRTQRITLNTQKRRALWRDIGISAVGTGASMTVLVVIVLTKFVHGAWVTVLLILLLTWLMIKTNKHYSSIDRQLALSTDPDQLAADRALPSRVHALIYVERVRKPVLRALAYARASRPSSIEALLVNVDQARTRENIDTWQALELPVDLTVLDSPYRNPAASLLEYVHQMRQKSPRDVLVVYLPEYVASHWWHGIFQRRTVHKLKARLRHEPGVVVASVPWQIDR